MSLTVNKNTTDVEQIIIETLDIFSSINFELMDEN
jgi:hypothetical protein